MLVYHERENYVVDLKPGWHCMVVDSQESSTGIMVQFVDSENVVKAPCIDRSVPTYVAQMLTMKTPFYVILPKSGGVRFCSYNGLSFEISKISSDSELGFAQYKKDNPAVNRPANEVFAEMCEAAKVQNENLKSMLSSSWKDE